MASSCRSSGKARTVKLAATISCFSRVFTRLTSAQSFASSGVIFRALGRTAPLMSAVSWWNSSSLTSLSSLAAAMARARSLGVPVRRMCSYSSSFICIFLLYALCLSFFSSAALWQLFSLRQYRRSCAFSARSISSPRP